jgi:hypothetical protein
LITLTTLVDMDGEFTLSVRGSRHWILPVRDSRDCLTTTPVVSVSHHYDVFGKRLVLYSANGEHHFLSLFENVTIHNIGPNEGDLGAVRAIDNPKSLPINFLDDPYHFVGSPGWNIVTFGVSPGSGSSKGLLYSLFFPARPMLSPPQREAPWSHASKIDRGNATNRWLSQVE